MSNWKKKQKSSTCLHNALQCSTWWDFYGFLWICWFLSVFKGDSVWVYVCLCGSDVSPMFSDNLRTTLEMLRQCWAWEALALPAGVGKIWSCDHLKYGFIQIRRVPRGSIGSTWLHDLPWFSNIFHVMGLWICMHNSIQFCMIVLYYNIL